jgi:hypothetical protein
MNIPLTNDNIVVQNTGETRSSLEISIKELTAEIIKLRKTLVTGRITYVRTNYGYEEQWN